MESDQFNQTRHNVLSRMRERWGTSRKTDEEQQSSDRIHQFESFLMPYLELAEVEESLVPPPLEPGNPQIRTMAENFRKIKKEKPHPLQEPIPKPGEGGGATAGTKRRELMLEIASAHFRNSMGSWMSSVAADHEVTTTPIEDLERMHEEAAYRLKVINTIMAMTEKEVDAIESQIKARKIQAERALEAMATATVPSVNGEAEKPGDVVLLAGVGAAQPPAEAPQAEVALTKKETPLKGAKPLKVQKKPAKNPAAVKKAAVSAKKTKTKVPPAKAASKSPKTAAANVKSSKPAGKALKVPAKVLRTVGKTAKVPSKNLKSAAKAPKSAGPPAKAPGKVSKPVRQSTKPKPPASKSKAQSAKPRR